MAHPNQQYYGYQPQPTANYPPAANPSLSYPPVANPPLSYPLLDNNPVYPPNWNNINNSMPAATSNYGSHYSVGHPSNGFPAYATPMVAVIGPQFCSPNPVDIIITRKMMKLTVGNFNVEDVNGNVMFKIKDGIQLLRDRRIVYDAQGKPIVTLQQKMMSAHSRWNAFRGDSKNPRDLLFSAKESTLLQLKTNLDVFLASNGHENMCDFTVKGTSWLERSCVIYGGNSNVVLAQMHKKLTAGSVLIGKDEFMVTVYPNVDIAFIVALIVILDAINQVV